MSRGRPKTLLDSEFIRSKLAVGCTITKIAEETGVTRNTLKRKMKESNIPRLTHVTLPDVEIDNLLTEAKMSLPFAGERLMIGYLKSKGYALNICLLIVLL